MQIERILDVFPAATEGHRLVIAVCQTSGQRDRFVLRQETFSSDVGWFVQSRVTIEAEQLAGLKAALTGGHPEVNQHRPVNPRQPVDQRQPAKPSQAVNRRKTECAEVILPFKAAAAG